MRDDQDIEIIGEKRYQPGNLEDLEKFRQDPDLNMLTTTSIVCYDLL
jgi:hypothetical protein